MKKPVQGRDSKIILGIDPGTNYTGYGVIESSGNSCRCVVLGFIELNRIKDPYAKLRRIFERVSVIIDEFRPDEIAFESTFFGENVQSMLKLGRAQGMAMAVALSRGIPVFEYAPRRIKQAITGNGGASKEQVASLLCRILDIDYSLKKLDATDGLAVALCHFYETSSPINSIHNGGAGTPVGRRYNGKSLKNSGSWEKFLSENPGREVKPRGGKTVAGKAIIKKEHN